MALFITVELHCIYALCFCRFQVISLLANEVISCSITLLTFFFQVGELVQLKLAQSEQCIRALTDLRINSDLLAVSWRSFLLTSSLIRSIYSLWSLPKICFGDKYAIQKFSYW